MPALNGEQLLSALAERHILLSGEEGRLRFRAPEGALDDPLKEALRAHKESLVSILRTQKGFVQLAPLSYNQLSLFFLHLLDSTTTAYNLALTMRLRASAQPVALREALTRLVRQHPQLRTTFSHVSLGDRAAPCQFTADDLAPVFIEIDASTWTEEKLRAEAQLFYATPLDLENGPVVRAGLFRGAKAGDVLILQLHHIAVDGWSLNLVARDLGRHYLAVTQGLASTETTTTATYADFAVAQRRWLTEPEGMAQMNFWREALLPPPPPLELGGSERRPAVRRAQGTTQYFEINATDKIRVETAASQLGVTPFAFLLGAFQIFLMRRARLNDVSVGIPTLGRRGVHVEKTVGYFVNPVALRCRRPSTLSFREHAQRTAQELAAALDRRDLPLTALVENLGGTRDLSRTPAFQVLFNLLSRRILGDVVDLLYPGADETTVNLGGGLTAGAFPLHQQEGQFDLTLEFVERGASWFGLFKYCTDLFTSTEAGAMVDEFRSLLEQVVTTPDGLLPENMPAATPGPAAEPRRQIAIAATFTAEPMQDTFEFWFDRLGWSADVAFAPFNQVFQELINPASLLRRNPHGANLVFLRFDDLVELTATNPQSAAARLQGNLNELITIVQTSTPALRVPLCIVICPSSPALKAAVADEAGLQTGFAMRMQAIPGVNVLTPLTIANWHPVEDWHEPAGEELGHIPYTPRYLAALATCAIRTLNALGQNPVKALVIDCDGTLWDGVVGEDGPERVVVGPLQQQFQQYLLAQHRAGVLLCLCSKNHEADAWAVFDRHPDMVLKREHVSFARINWLPKSANLQSLAAEINIGLNALAFLDDNALERAEVRAGCPAVLCPELPVAWEERVTYLQNLWPLDRLRVTGEDQKRVDHYRTERLRADLRRDAGSFVDFLTNLELVVEIRPAVTADIDRLAQLTIRTNQFNSTLHRLTAAEVASHIDQTDRAALVTQVRDRFGDYGLVGAAFFKKQGDVLTVDPILLSCRALGRGVEHRMAAYLGAYAVASGCNWVEFPVRPTDRNEPARTFLLTLERDCTGARNATGTLRLAAPRLESVQFKPDNTATAATPEPQAPPITARSAAPRDARLIQIAAELPTPDALFTELTKWRQQRHSRPIPPTRPSEDGAPLSDTEQTIANAWKKILALAEIGTSENFFEVGGTSILAAQLALELRRQGLAATIVDLFHYPTIAALARNMNGALSPQAKPTASRLAEPKPPAAPSSRQLPAAFERLRRFRGK